MNYTQNVTHSASGIETIAVFHCTRAIAEAGHFRCANGFSAIAGNRHLLNHAFQKYCGNTQKDRKLMVQVPQSSVILSHSRDHKKCVFVHRLIEIIQGTFNQECISCTAEFQH